MTDYCTGCGRLSSGCPGCGRQLDPPRFCPSCGRRLTVSVTPGGYRVRCRDHGELVSSEPRKIHPMAEARPLIYDPFDPDTQQDPYPVYRRLRDEDPVHLTPRGYWVLSDSRTSSKPPRIRSPSRRPKA